MQPDQNDILFDTIFIDAAGMVGEGAFGRVSTVFADAFLFLIQTWNTFAALSLFFSFLLFLFLIFALMRRAQLSEARNEFITELEENYQRIFADQRKQSRLTEIERRLRVDDPNSWKLAIIEADVLLQETLERHGYGGDTIGEMLKSIPKQALAHLNDAWEAHKVRNQIAHSGSDFVLTKKVAKDALVQYRLILNELGVE